MATETVNVDKSAVHIDQTGQITIRDPKVIDVLKAKGIQSTTDLRQSKIWNTSVSLVSA